MDSGARFQKHVPFDYDRAQHLLHNPHRLRIKTDQPCGRRTGSIRHRPVQGSAINRYRKGLVPALLEDLMAQRDEHKAG